VRRGAPLCSATKLLEFIDASVQEVKGGRLVSGDGIVRLREDAGGGVLLDVPEPPPVMEGRDLDTDYVAQKFILEDGRVGGVDVVYHFTTHRRAANIMADNKFYATE